MFRIFTVVAVFMLFFNHFTNAQSFGFGCLGFVGGYGGYSYQIYKPTGLNNYISVYNSNRMDSLAQPIADFGKAKGYRIGINFFRANFTGFILTVKGFYQSLTEKSKAIVNSSKGEINREFELDLKNWGVGVDLGTSLTGALSWKVIDAALLFNFATFSDTRNSPGAITEVFKYDNENPTIGYSIGTGFIFAIVDEYITLEGLAGYTVFTIEKMVYNKTEYLTVSEDSTTPMPKLIEAGGFNAVIQLNIGFPL